MRRSIISVLMSTIGLGEVEALRAGLDAVHDGVAVEPERVIEAIEPLALPSWKLNETT